METPSEGLARSGRRIARSVLGPLYQRAADRIAARLEPEIARFQTTLDAVRSTLEAVEATLETIRATVESIRPTLDAKVADMHAELEGHLRSETEELARMLRLQGDADDELAATLGRTLARLSAEVETLSASVGHVEAASRPALPGTGRSPAGSTDTGVQQRDPGRSPAGDTDTGAQRARQAGEGAPATGAGRSPAGDADAR